MLHACALVGPKYVAVGLSLKAQCRYNFGRTPFVFDVASLPANPAAQAVEMHDSESDDGDTNTDSDYTDDDDDTNLDDAGSSSWVTTDDDEGEDEDDEEEVGDAGN